ncbi:hypothetical protein FRC03_001020 [Tulasnella sp. 419]|nr:hypothetical protein FRC03_001020 [Tulasnella sp. 419]
MIELKNLPIPITIRDKDKEEGAQNTEVGHTADAFPFTRNFIVQSLSDVEPYQPQTKFFLQGDDDEPLLGLKLTFWKNKTIMGIAWSHTLGDAKAFYHFTVYLSGLYQDLNAPEDRLPMKPFFPRHVFTASSKADAETAQRFQDRMPHLREDFTPPELFEKHTTMDATTDEIQIRLSGATLDKIYEKAQADDNQGLKLTTVDALMAYLTTILNQCYETPSQCVINTVDYRSPANATSYPSFLHPASASNCILMMYSDQIPRDKIHSIPAIAQIIRKSIIQGREPEFVEMWISFASEYLRKSANADRVQWFPPRDGECLVNSNYRTDWNDAHFGFKGHSKFFTSWAAERYFRVFTSNPETQAPSSKGTRSADVNFCVRRDLREKAINILRADFPEIEIDGVN